VPETLRQRTVRLLREHKLRASKRLGQHFLVDDGVARDIVDAAELRPEDGVIEIGAGFGALTEHLAGVAHRVVAVEVDRGIASVLKQRAHDWPSTQVLHADFLKLDLEAACGDGSVGAWKVVGNLPYSLTTPILHRLREHSGLFERSVITMQAEVADRLRAGPGSRTYGAVSVAVQADFTLEAVRSVPPQAFFPAPDVVSQVICLRPHAEPTVPEDERAMLEQVVRAAFAQRRKTVLNSLVGSGRLSAGREEIGDALAAAGIDAGRRAESLSLGEFVALAREIDAAESGGSA
jgi:16S rRNA (adenine1518-N6/adenine1519-N6)-dimethyltransferase